MLSGYIVLFIAAINDILYDQGLLKTGFFLHIGMIVFILSQSVVLSIKFNNTIDKIFALSGYLSREQKNLEDKKNELDLKVSDRVKIINSQKEELENQIVLAENIQKSILPAEAPDLKGVRISFIYKPMMQIGGDFVDYIIKNNNEIGFFICDVSGHGVPGAFLSSMVKMELLNKWYENISSPEKVLNNIYNSINKNLGGNFITASVSYLNIETGEFKIANAGHPSAFYIHENREIDILKPKGKAIYEYFKPDFEVISLNLIKGSKVFMYTDGIIESFNAGLKQFGENRLIDFLKNHSNMDVNVMCNAVLQEVLDYAGGEKKLGDDVTMLAFEYTGI
jgi:serine phosphatase RsbU (regulator of sigma subunit)